MNNDANPPPPPLSARDALFLDFDGTLIDLSGRPETVYLSETDKAVLRGLCGRLQGAVAVISGRTLDSLDVRLDGLSIAASGEHGREVRFADGRLDRAVLDLGALSAVRQTLKACAERHPEVVYEEKPAGAGLHFRHAPAAEAECRVAAAAAFRAAGGAFEILNAKALYELKPAGVSKARAIDLYLSAAPFSGRRPVYIGDDTTDEPAFARVNDRGGLSICVGARANTFARYRLDSVEAVYGYLNALLGKV